jgi:hypothetical protein
MVSSTGGCGDAGSVNGVPPRRRGEERVVIDRTAGLKGSVPEGGDGKGGRDKVIAATGEEGKRIVWYGAYGMAGKTLACLILCLNFSILLQFMQSCLLW